MNWVNRSRAAILIFLGVITPIFVLAVNVSAFIMAHLNDFRIAIALLALVSGLLLNGLSAYWALRFAQRQATPLFTEYRVWITALAVIAVLLSAVIGAYLNYLGLVNRRQLPNGLSVLGAVFTLAVPFGFTFFQRRILPRISRRYRHSGGTGPMPGAAQAASRRRP
ncbi:MAG TPA: hypothetical protein VIA06_09265 [Candidatus Dormibacteraeota bacterium]|jgi:energy-converting hydrogenase Eha subunit A|nr:hypothetical protein [Candidatus Dormibacteraeota bacterium]